MRFRAILFAASWCGSCRVAGDWRDDSCAIRYRCRFDLVRSSTRGNTGSIARIGSHCNGKSNVQGGRAGMAVTSLVVLQSTPFCNINCSYCYLPQRDDRQKLDIADVGRIFEKLVTFPTIGERVTVVWHAGEPLVLGPEYYEAAFTCISEKCPKNLTVQQSFQTNGMLIDDAWCDLFERWDVSLGVSIDGPKNI